MDRRSSGVVSRKGLALTDDPRVLLIEKIKAQIWPLVEGHGPEIQSAVIADMLATLLAGHAPPIREQGARLNHRSDKTAYPDQRGAAVSWERPPIQLAGGDDERWRKTLMTHLWI